jgi:hypothetical protein
LTGCIGRAGFGVRVAFCAVATVLLVLAFRGSGGPVIQARAAPPWPAPASVPVGVRAAGLAPPASPGDVVRFAVHLDVIVDGRRVTVPPGIGVDRRDRQVAALHTSDSSGIAGARAAGLGDADAAPGNSRDLAAGPYCGCGRLRLPGRDVMPHACT